MLFPTNLIFAFFPLFLAWFARTHRAAESVAWQKKEAKHETQLKKHIFGRGEGTKTIRFILFAKAGPASSCNAISVTRI